MEESQSQGSESVVESSGSLLDAQPSAVEVAPNSNIEVTPKEKEAWNWAEEMPGTGDVPDWFNLKKYKSVEEQAKAQQAFEKRLGGFTGAPEAYDVTLSEDIEGKASLDIESEEYKAFETFARDNNMSNDIFNGLVNQYLNSFSDSQDVSEEVVEQHKQEEMAKLGDKGAVMIDEVSSWAKNNLDESEFEAFRGLADSAENIVLLQKMISKTASVKVQAKAEQTPAFSREDLRGMIGDPRYETDMAFRAQVDSKYKTLAESGHLGTKNALGF